MNGEVVSSRPRMKPPGTFRDLQHRRLGPAGRRRRRMAAGVVVVVVIVVIVVACLAGVTRAVELFVGDEGAQVIEADVAGAAVARPAFAGVQTFVRRRRVLALLLHLAGDRRRQRRRWRRRRRRRRGRWRWRLRALPYFRLAVHLDLSGDVLRRRGGRGFGRRQRRLVIQHARYVILFLGHKERSMRISRVKTRS